ncbi:MAG: type II secretion system F family protein [Pirellulales bacterium]
MVLANCWVPRRRGQLGPVLAGLCDLARRRRARSEQLASTFIYPAVLMLLALVVGIIVTFYVRPEIASTLLVGKDSLVEDFGILPPSWTLVKTSYIDANWLHERQPWPIVFAFAGLFGVCLVGAVSRTAAPALFDRLCGWVPIVGMLLRRAHQEQWCRLVGLLASLGRPMEEAAETSAAILPPGEVARSMHEVGRRLRQGDTFTHALVAATRLPATAVAVVAWGETNHQIADALGAVGDLLAGDVEARMEMLKNVVGPLILVFVAGFVASFLSAVIESLYILIHLIEALS